MANNWIFISVPYTDFNRGNINEIANKIKESRMWPIGRKTRFRNLLSKGDNVLFYQGGDEGGKIVGSAVLASGVINNEKDMYDFVSLANLELWKRPVEIRTVREKLSFIKNSKNYGVYFQGGIIKIPEKDFEQIRHCLQKPAL